MEKKNLGNVHRSVSLPPDWWEAIEIAAASKGVAGTSISKWIAEAVRNALPEDIMLTTKNGRGRPRLNETKRPRAKPKIVAVKTDWRKTCDLCRKNPKPEDGKICESCQPKKPLTIEHCDFCRCDSLKSMADCVCGSLERFTAWQTTSPE